MGKARITAESLGLKNPEQHVPAIVTSALDTATVTKLSAEVLRDGPVTLDHAKATEYIDLPVFPGERDINDRWVQTLYDEMRKGTFNERLVVLSTASLDGVVYKINGQHTCWAVIHMPSNYTLNVREIRYKAKDRAQLKLIYSTYDRLNVRTDTHITKVILTDCPVMEGVWTSLLGKLLSGLKLWLFVGRTEQDRATPDILAAIIQRERFDVFRSVAMAIQHLSDSSRKLLSQSVIAAFFATYDKVPTKAAEFWVPVLEGTDLGPKTDPRWRLRDLLLRLQEIRLAGRAEKVPYSREELYTVCLSAWNKWRRGEKVSTTIRPLSERPKLL